MVFWQFISFLAQSDQRFCNHLVSISVHPSFFVNNLLQICSTKWNQTWQGWFLGKGDSNLCKQVYPHWRGASRGRIKSLYNSFSRTIHRSATLFYCVTSWYVDLEYENKGSRVWKINKKIFSEELAMEMNV